MTRQIKFILFILVIAGMSSNSYSSSNNMHNNNKMHQHSNHMQQSNTDSRISLNMPPQMKSHQLAKMRDHMAAVQTIIALLAEGKFEHASNVAYSKLGLTEDMKKMCNALGNEEFKRLGLAFHESADVLGDALKSKDLNKSLTSLSNTMNYCVECHATFRQ